MNLTTKVRNQHLLRPAIIYIRQSTMTQVRFNRESTERQYNLQDKALQLGWTLDQIRTIDEDLGLSGAQSLTRQGYQQLVAQVSLGQVGAILGLEISRLARSCADLLKLLELCALFDTLVIDEDGIYDLSDFNDRLILGFKGTMSEAELHFLRSRLLGGKKNKAQKGELRFPLPVGYVYDSQGKTVIDPDQQVQQAVRQVFSFFQACGSGYGVVRSFSQNGLRFPKRAYGGTWDGKIAWGTLTHSRVLTLLKNPCYSGTYVYGRFRGTKEIGATGAIKVVTKRLPQENWEVVLHDHHEGYISWEEYEANCRQLENNQTNKEVSGAAREGKALLQGIIICGRCGAQMTVRYTGTGGIRPQYECRHRWKDQNRSTCSSVPGNVVDTAIEAHILKALEPANWEIALLAVDKTSQSQLELGKNWRMAIERAEYEVDRAHRQYDMVEPENRLVARSLESKWNEKLAELESLHKDYEHYRHQHFWIPNSEEQRQILEMAAGIPELWHSNSTNQQDRKRIVRLLIEDITVTCSPRSSEVTLGIRWHSGYSEVLQTSKALPHSMVRKHTTDTIKIISELAKRMTDGEISEYLRKEGYKTSENKDFTIDSVRWIRHKHHILGPQRAEKELTVSDAAELFNVHKWIVYSWLSSGTLTGTKRAPGWPWSIVIDDPTKERLEAWLQDPQNMRRKKTKKCVTYTTKTKKSIEESAL